MAQAKLTKRLDTGRIGIVTLIGVLGLYSILSMNWLALMVLAALFYYVVEYYHAKNYIAQLKYTIYTIIGGDDDGSDTE